ncbi:helix-turn-helix transcriptional regulator, partial [Aliivibrio sifiae]
MKNLFEQILKKYRLKSGITQEFMVDLLSNNSSNLKKLDNVTFSRWERGITIPPFRKQIEIYRLLGVDPIDEIIELDIELPNVDAKDYFISDYYTESVNDFYSYYLNRTNIDEVSDFVNDVELIENNDVYVKRILGSLKLGRKDHVIKMLIEKFNAEIIICKYNQRIIAHSITLYIEPDFIKDIVAD